MSTERHPHPRRPAAQPQNLDLDLHGRAHGGDGPRARQIQPGVRHPVRRRPARYVETFSAYARQFLDCMDRPAVDAVEGVPPAIAIDQTNPCALRSTVGTMTRSTTT